MSIRSLLIYFKLTLKSHNRIEYTTTAHLYVEFYFYYHTRLAFTCCTHIYIQIYRRPTNRTPFKKILHQCIFHLFFLSLLLFFSFRYTRCTTLAHTYNIKKELRRRKKLKKNKNFTFENEFFFGLGVLFLYKRDTTKTFFFYSKVHKCGVDVCSMLYIYT